MSTAASTISDSRLTRRAVRGSSRAFEAIFRRYHQDLYRYCAAIVGNSADAQDAVQNTMVKVLQALPGEERQIELKPWLYRIAHNESIEIVRRRRPSEQIDADSLLGPASAAEQVETRERLRRLVRDVAELPERQRGVLVMRELGGLDFEEIGAAFGTTAATARQTLYEARLGLQAMSEGREMDCAEATRAISDGDRRLFRGRKLRAHLRACGGCRAFRAEIEGRRTDLALLAPLPAVASAGILHGVLGGAAASKSLLGATAIKTAAAIGVVAAVGVTAADRSGLIHLGQGHSVAPPPAKSAPPTAGTARSPAATAPGLGGAPATDASAGAREAGVGAKVRAEAALSGRHPVGRETGAAEPQSRPPEARSPGAAPAAAVPPPAAAAPSEHTDGGRHLGELKHPEQGHSASPSSGSKGRSDEAPGRTKAPHTPAGPSHSPGNAAHVETKPAHSHGSPAGSAPGHAKQAAPETPSEAPAADQAEASPPVTATDPTAAESPVTPHGKAHSEPSTP